MLVDDATFYFLTAKGKAFYDQLMDQKYIALSGMAGGEGMDIREASVHKKAISIRGSIESIGSEKLDEIFENNPYMAQIYPKPETRQALEVFCMTAGEGEFFDLSTKPITREQFRIGKDADKIRKRERAVGYFITDRCIGCGTCVGICPQNCICGTALPYVIEQKHCLHCGNCYRECPVEAVVRVGL